MIIFKTVRWKNLLSTGNQWTELSLNSHHSTLIVGENGAGKTTIIDAIFYSLYGKPLRPINKPQLVNTITAKDMLVEIEFSISSHQYLVRRGMKPNIFEIWVDGRMLDQESATRDQQVELETQILKMNYKSFSQIVVLSMANYTPFMRLKADQRRAVIEDLLDIQIFTIMNSILKDQVSANKDSLNQVDHLLALDVKAIELHKKHMAEMSQNVEELIEEKKRKILYYREQTEKAHEALEGLNKKIEEQTALIANQSNTAAQAKRLQDDIKKLDLQDKRLDGEIEFYKTNTSCPTCKQDIDEEFRKTQIGDKETLQSKVRAHVPKLRDTLASVKEELLENKRVSEKIADLNKAVSNNLFEIQTNKRFTESLNKDIQGLEDRKKDIRSDTGELEKYQSQYEGNLKTKEDLVELRDLYGIASQMLKDGGIKTQIIRQYIPIMNKLINSYLAKMDFFVDFNLDEQFNETLKSRFRDEFSYESFSRGEQLRIDLSLLFAWRALAKMRNSASTNLLFFDEILDSSLDNTGVDELLDIVATLSGETNLFIISHKDSMVEKFERVLVAKKSNNFSRIEELT